MIARNVCFALLFAFSLHAGEISTVAGTGKPEDGPAAGRALETNIGEPFGVEFGPDGALYVTEVRNHRVRRIDLAAGSISTVAGCGKKGYAGDGGPASEALLNEPYEVRFDSAGNMLFVEMKNHLVRKVDRKTGIISTVAGTGAEGFSGDGGPAVKATFKQPHSIALDAQDNIYIADILNHRIRRVDAKSGTIDTIAGTGEKKMPKNGDKALGTPLNGPRSFCVAGETLWVCFREGNSVWTLDLKAGTWKHIGGNGKKGHTGDGGNALQATLDGPKGIALGPDGACYLVDTENQAIRRIDAKTNVITTVAGSGPKFMGELGDGGLATSARLARPHGMCVGKDGSLYIGDSNNHRVRKVSP